MSNFQEDQEEDDDAPFALRTMLEWLDKRPPKKLRFQSRSNMSQHGEEGDPDHWYGWEISAEW